MLNPRQLLLSVATLTAAATSAVAFQFSYGDVSQCGDLNVTWSGGTPPFQLLITPSFGTPKNISIPASAYNNGNGSYSVPLAFKEDKKVLLTMSDAMGFNTGGTSDLVTVGAPKGASCDVTDVGVDFFFQANLALAQCRTYRFEGYNASIQPVTIWGFIPGGDVFRLNPPTNSELYDWTCTVPAGTDIVFALTDSRGRQGGSAEVRTVGQSGESSCLGQSPPQSTQNAPTATNTAKPSPSPSNGDKPSVALIIGAVLGTLLVIACAVSFALFYIRRRRARKAWSPGNTRHSRFTQSIDLLHGGPGSQGHGDRPVSPYDDPHTGNLPLGHEPDPYMLTTPTTNERYADTASSAGAAGVGAAGGNAHGRAHRPSMTATNASSAARRKAEMAGVAAYQPASRFILHTDIEEAQPNSDGFIELPPQYSASRAPLSTVGTPSPDTTPTADPFSTPAASRHPSDVSRHPSVRLTTEDHPQGYPPS